MSEKMEFRAHDIVLEYIQRHLDKSDDVPNIEIYTVWKCKILQNWKFLISSSLLDGMYYELTFNGNKNEWYLDAYKKFENQVIREDTVNAPQTKRYDYSKSVMENIKCGNGITREIPQNEKEQSIKIGDEVYVHGYIDEIKQDIVIIYNKGSYFGTVLSEVVKQESKRGKWIPQNHNKTNGRISTAVYYYPKCSVCGLCANYTNFCPNCGARMER